MPPLGASRIVGLDLSLTSTGIAIVDVASGELPAWKTFRVESTGHRGDTLAQRRQRLSDLAQAICAHVGNPRLVVLEAPAFSRTVGSQHDRSGLWWLIVDILALDGVPVTEVMPSGRAKYGTGKGNAAKDAVLAAAIRRYPDADIQGNDVADAVILAAMGARHAGFPVEGNGLPIPNLSAMAGVVWTTEG